MMLPKKKRNQELVALRDKDPEQYSFRTLGEIFRVSTATAFEIYHREKAKEKKGEYDLPSFVKKKYPTL